MLRVQDDASDPAAAEPPFRVVPPLVIGLLGGIAAGKSTVAAAFARRGLHHVDADRHARAVVEDAAVLAQLHAGFGDGILRPDGGLDRAALAARVFQDPAAKRQLEAITHPPIRRAILADAERALAAGESVLLDVPLLLENGLIERCQATVFVDASEAVRRARAASRGWPEGELERRQATQAPLAEKRARADFVIDNDGPLAATERAVEAVLAQLRQRSG